jgi:hypothetical protein
MQSTYILALLLVGLVVMNKSPSDPLKPMNPIKGLWGSVTPGLVNGVETYVYPDGSPWSVSGSIPTRYR